MKSSFTRFFVRLDSNSQARRIIIEGLFAAPTIVTIVSRSRDAVIIIYSIITQRQRNSKRKSANVVTKNRSNIVRVPNKP